MDIRQQLLAAFAVEYREHVDAIRVALAGAEGGAPDWNDIFRRAHSLKGAARAVDLPPVEAIAHRLETLFERIAGGATALDRAATDAVHLALDRIEACVAGLADGVAVSADDAMAALDRRLDDAGSAPPPREPETLAETTAPGPAVEAAGTVLRVPADAVEALTQATHDLASALGGEAAIADGLARFAVRARDLGRRAEGLRAGARRDATRRGPERGEDAAAKALDDLRATLGAFEADLVALARDASELSRTRAGVAAAIEGGATRVRTEAERLSLVPAESVFGGFARALRDMAREADREVDVGSSGLDLPLDRAMLQVLKDPVLHALRNALSHGAEAPEARRRAGKPPALSIALEIAIRGGRLEIAVHDDGRGPDLGAIEAQARRRGLLGPGEAAEPDRLLALVFEPGFSTAPAVDTLSGRGIGLSVVADAVRRLGGGVRLRPREPWGTTLAMALPLSAARRSMLLVEAGHETFALPSQSVERLLRLRPSDLGSVMGRRVARIECGEAERTTLSIADLGALVGTARERPADSDGTVTAVLLRAAGLRCVLAVDRLHDVRTLLVLPAPPIGADARLIAGTVILAGDRPSLVLDPEGVIARAGESASPASELRTQPQGTMRDARRSTILVVDDSITTRTLEKGILEAAGYRVVVCVDGQDALDRLRAGIESVDLVVADVEMPRLDGFGLVKALRAEEAFARMPIILMTSRGDAEDVARGLDLGADAYLTKQKFDQRELLDTIGQLL